MNRQDIPALTGLRAIAAAWVLIFHAESTFRIIGGIPADLSKYLGIAGYLGVDIFFVLSGFVLAFNYAESHVGSSLKSYAAFMWKRVARIYPVHIAALILFVAFLLLAIAVDIPKSTDRLTPESLLATITMTHAWTMPIPKHWNVVSWSISAEFAAYLCFPIIATMALRFKSIYAACAMIVGLFMALASVKHFGTYNGTMAYGLARIAVEFPAGVLVYRIYRLANQSQSLTADRVALFSLIALIISATVIDFQEKTMALVYCPIIACVIVYSLAVARGPFAAFLSNRSMQHLGRVSYSFYLVHGTCLSFAGAIVRNYALKNNDLLGSLVMIGGILVAYAIAVWFFHSIEEPARKAMLNMTRKEISKPQSIHEIMTPREFVRRSIGKQP